MPKGREDHCVDDFMMAGLTCILVLFITLCHGETHVVNGPATRTDITQASTSNTICTDCIQIVELFKDMLTHEDIQENLYGTLNIFCLRLPGSQKVAKCKSLLQEQLPKVYKYLTNQMVSGDACMGLGLCALQPMTGGSVMLPGKDESSLVSVMPPGKDESSLVPEASTSLQVQIGPQCTFCVLLIKKLENMLPKEKTEDTVVQLMGEVCDLLPASFKDQCDNFVDKYGKKLVDFLLSSAAPHSICVLLHLCLIKEAPVPEMPLPSDCESCRTLAVLGRLHLGFNASASHTSSFLRSVCLQHPGAIPKCEVFTRLHWSKLQKVLGSRKNECWVICRVPKPTPTRKSQPVNRRRPQCSQRKILLVRLACPCGLTLVLPSGHMTQRFITNHRCVYPKQKQIIVF